MIQTLIHATGKQIAKSWSQHEITKCFIETKDEAFKQSLQIAMNINNDVYGFQTQLDLA